MNRREKLNNKPNPTNNKPRCISRVLKVRRGHGPHLKLEKNDGLSLTTLKLGSLLLIWLVGTLGGIAPQFSKQSAMLLGFGNCFSGGVFLAAAITHLLPEAVEGFLGMGEAYERHAYFFCLLGILIPFLVERVLIKKHSHEVVFGIDTTSNSLLSVYLLLCMLAVHSFIEGIALGVQQNSMSTWTVLWAIVAHKFFAAFALGVSLLKGGVSNRWFLQIITFFSLTTPVGGILGMLVNLSFNSGVAAYTSEAFKGIAAGTFIYVSLMEVLDHEFAEHGHKDHPEPAELEQTDKFKKFGFIAAGITLMSFVSVFGGHSHDPTNK